MKIKNVELETVCGYTSTLPQTEKTQIAFAGRSNVGKSSLINVLMQRKRLARVGETPGKTRTINFYKVDAIVPVPAETEELTQKEMNQENLSRKEENQESLSRKETDQENLIQKKVRQESLSREEVRSFYLVDLPGYGYANVPQSEKEKWGRMIERYLHTSRSLKAVFLLVDIRHEPNANDRQMFEWIAASGFSPIIVATKADKIKRSQLSKQLKIIKDGLKAPKGTVVIPFSALAKSGREEIADRICEFL